MKTSKNTISKDLERSVVIINNNLFEKPYLFIIFFYQAIGSLKDFPIEQMSILDLIDAYNVSKEAKLKDIIINEIEKRVLFSKNIQEELKKVLNIKDKEEKNQEDLYILIRFGSFVYETLESAKAERKGYEKGKFNINCSMIFKNYKDMKDGKVPSLKSSDLFNDKAIETLSRLLHEYMISNFFSVSVLSKNGSKMQKLFFNLAIENFIIESDMGTFLYQGLIHSNKNSSIHKNMFEIFKEFSTKSKNALSHWLFICKCKKSKFFNNYELEYAYNYVKNNSSSFMECFDLFQVSCDFGDKNKEKFFNDCIEKAKNFHEFKTLLENSSKLKEKYVLLLLDLANNSASSIFEKKYLLSTLFYKGKMEYFDKVFEEFKSMIKSIQDFKDAYFLIDEMEDLSKKYLKDLVFSLDVNISIKPT